MAESSTISTRMVRSAGMLASTASQRSIERVAKFERPDWRWRPLGKDRQFPPAQSSGLRQSKVLFGFHAAQHRAADHVGQFADHAANLRGRDPDPLRSRPRKFAASVRRRSAEQADSQCAEGCPRKSDVRRNLSAAAAIRRPRRGHGLRRRTWFPGPSGGGSPACSSHCAIRHQAHSQHPFQLGAQSLRQEMVSLT